MDFGGGNAEAVKVINWDVCQATGGLVPSVVDSIEPATVLILVNAIYFKGLWAVPFEAARTVDQQFRLSSGGSIRTRG